MKQIKFLILAGLAIGALQGILFSGISSRIEGDVIDESAGPVSGAWVLLFGCVDMTPDTSCNRVNGSITDNKGHFRFDGIESGVYALFVLEDGYASSGPYANILEELDSKGPTSQTIEIPPQYKFKVKEGQIKYFRIKLEKEAILKVNVTAKYPGGATPKSQLFSQITIKHPSYINEIDGMNETFETSYQSKYLKEGLIDVLIRSWGYVAKNYQVQLKKGETVTIEHILDFTTGQVLSGKIVDKDSGKPLENVSVDLSEYDSGIQSFTDENGNYWIGGIEPGVHHFSVSYQTGKSMMTSITINKGKKKEFNVAL